VFDDFRAARGEWLAAQPASFRIDFLQRCAFGGGARNGGVGGDNASDLARAASSRISSNASKERSGATSQESAGRLR